ncbi:SUKH-3 domain-containing protein [Micromonospora sp. NPDC003197]
METRLAATTQRVLENSGWQVGTHDEEQAHKLIEQVRKRHQRGGEEPAPSFPALVKVLATYGGLRVANSGTGRTAYREDFNLIPIKGFVWRDGLDEIAEVAEEKVFPLGDVPDVPGKLLITERGRVVLFGPNGYFLVGNDINEALNNMVEGVDLPYFDSD